MQHAWLHFAAAGSSIHISHDGVIRDTYPASAVKANDISTYSLGRPEKTEAPDTADQPSITVRLLTANVLTLIERKRQNKIQKLLAGFTVTGKEQHLAAQLSQHDIHITAI